LKCSWGWGEGQQEVGVNPLAGGWWAGKGGGKGECAATGPPGGMPLLHSCLDLHPAMHLVLV
jgi:hypothetical protein